MHRLPASCRVLALLASLALGACAGNPSRDRTDPDSPEPDRLAQIKTDLAIEYMRDGRNEIALRRLREAIDLEPNFAPAHTALGLLYARLRQDDDAERHFRRALRSAPNDAGALNNYGLFLCQRGRTDDAIGMFEQAAANPLYETPEIALSNAGTCLLDTGRAADAEGYLRRALQADARLAPALLQLAQISYDRQDFLPARAFLQRYLEVARHTPRSLWLGIRIERELGDRDALGSYELQLNRNFPDSDEARLLRESRAR